MMALIAKQRMISLPGGCLKLSDARLISQALFTTIIDWRDILLWCYACGSNTATQDLLAIDNRRKQGVQGYKEVGGKGHLSGVKSYASMTVAHWRKCSTTVLLVYSILRLVLPQGGTGLRNSCKVQDTVRKAHIAFTYVCSLGLAIMCSNMRHMD